jgi:hypothetical protein
VIRITWRQLQWEPDLIAADLRAALGAPSGVELPLSPA